ncbi:MAG: response regulator [Gammaproteobacteria bacterium]|nr:response regulator [Gammaproteobacteria bacterium]NNM19855.1 response regulator [Gammaproteobacteria bacterium]
MSNGEQPTLLVVEDSPEDYEMICRGLRHADVAANIEHCIDGDAALEHLAGCATAQLPDLVLLDLNLPGTDGRDVLRAMQGDARIASVPVVVFSNSSNSNDVSACYKLGANSFIEKPLGPAAFKTVMQQLRDYWLDLVRLPSR